MSDRFDKLTDEELSLLRSMVTYAFMPIHQIYGRPRAIETDMGMLWNEITEAYLERQYRAEEVEDPSDVPEGE